MKQKLRPRFQILTLVISLIVFGLISSCHLFSPNDPQSAVLEDDLIGKRFFAKIYIAYQNPDSRAGAFSFVRPGIYTVVLDKNRVKYESRLFFIKNSIDIIDLENKDKQKNLQYRGMPAGTIVKIIEVEKSKNEVFVKLKSESNGSSYGVLSFQKMDQKNLRDFLDSVIPRVLKPLPEFKNQDETFKYLEGTYGTASNHLLALVTGFAEDKLDEIYFQHVMDPSIAGLESITYKKFRDYIFHVGPVLAAKSKLLIREVSLIEKSNREKQLYIRARYLIPLQFSEDSAQIRAGIVFYHVILPLTDNFIPEIPSDIGKIHWDIRYKVQKGGENIIEKNQVIINKPEFQRYQLYEITAQDLANTLQISVNDEEMEINLMQIQDIKPPMQLQFE